MIRQRVRPGTTLTEVLVAMFIMAAGMLALFTLFPLGAMQVGQALKDDRTAQAAQITDTYIRSYWRQTVVDPLSQGLEPTDPFVFAMDDPNLVGQFPMANWSPYSTFIGAPYRVPSGGVPAAAGNISPFALKTDVINATPPPMGVPTLGDPSYYVIPGRRDTRPSYPVYIDPINYLSFTGAQQVWVGRNAANTLFLPRRNLIATSTNTSALSNFSMLDDLTYDPAGSVENVNMVNGTLTPKPPVRQGRYNTAAIIQRPSNINMNEASLTVLVFDGRPPFLPIAGDELMQNAPGTVTVGDRQAIVTVPIRGPEQSPLLRRGGWIMDGTIDTTNGIRNAHFYRVVGITELTPPTNTITYAVDLETPIRPPTGNPTLATYQPQWYLFAGLAEVFERPLLKPDYRPQP